MTGSATPPRRTRRVKHAVSLAIRRPSGPGLLLVQRPPDDPDLPNAWGLPAASLEPGEGWAEAAARAARDKLGIEVRLGRELNRGTLERRDYTLEMRLFAATIEDGEPAVPQPAPGVTQYRDWRWGEAAELAPAAHRGSLCCRLMLEAPSGAG